MWVQNLWDGLQQAIHLIITGDPEVIDVTVRSLQVSFYAIVLASLIGVPLGLVIGIRDFRGKRFVKTVFTTLIGVPTVALGLILFLLLARAGPFGSFELVYTVQGISLGEALLVIPIIVSFTGSAVESRDIRLRDLCRTLGASELETSITILREAASPIALAIVSAFNRAFAELGIAMMIGGNIRGFTRVLTTSIALQTAIGDIPIAIALSIILMIVVFVLTLVSGNIGTIVSRLRREG